MAKYKKNANRKRFFLKLIISLLSIGVLIGIITILYLTFNNNISKYLLDESPKNVSNEEAKNATPIILNNVLLGGVYNNKFVSIDKYYLNSTNKVGTKINLYTSEGKIGEYEITALNKENKFSTVYVKNSKENLIREYFGIISSQNIVYNKLDEVKINEDYEKIVKESLGLYKILNNSVKILKVCENSISKNDRVKIITATSEPNKGIGAYSIIVIYDELKNKTQCLKYNYVRNKENSSEFGILSIKFIADLNNDGANEIIIQETKEFETIYSIYTFKNGKYYEVLSSEVKN